MFNFIRVNNENENSFEKEKISSIIEDVKKNETDNVDKENSKNNIYHTENNPNRPNEDH